MLTRDQRARSLAIPMVALSVALHGGAFAAVARVRPAPPRERIELEVVRRAELAGPSRPSPSEPERVDGTRSPRPPRRVAAAAARTIAPAPAPDAPPPTLASPPAAVPDPAAPRAIPRVGISLGSTVASGGFAIGLGNTAHGAAGEVAADPSSVAPYRGGVVPAERLSARPRPLELPRIEYPPQARREGVEGQVALVLRIDDRGVVTAVRVVGAPSPALAAAAAEGARRFRFTPALVAGEPVETEIRFTYTFMLE